MKIVADSKIPFLKGVFDDVAQVIYLDPKDINADSVKDADALIIRTRTRCDASLLDGSKVKMIATATIGFDHIDARYCEDNNIYWINAPGCNASSVAQYVISSLLVLKGESFDNIKGLNIGIVGVGNVGKAVEKAVREYGLNVYRCDPLRAESEPQEKFYSLEQIGELCDVITFHTPITTQGRYKTYHLAGKAFFDNLTKKPVIINAARGGVVDEAALLEAYERGDVSSMVIDCWENEPDINLCLLEKSIITTPHIAGYSADGKANATKMACSAVNSFFNLGKEAVIESISAPEPENKIIDTTLLTGDKQAKAYLYAYDVRRDSERLVNAPDSFEKQRGDYPFRREMVGYKIV